MENKKLYGFYSATMQDLYGYCTYFAENGKKVAITIVTDSCSTIEEFRSEFKGYPKDAIFVGALGEFISNSRQKQISNSFKGESINYRADYVKQIRNESIPNSTVVGKFNK